MRPLDAVAPHLGALMRSQAERTRRTVAVSRADVEKGPNVTLSELLRLPLRTPEGQEAFLERLGTKMASEVRERGDRRIDDPGEVADAFTARVREAVHRGRESGIHPVLWLLGQLDLRREGLADDATLEDLQRIAFHRHRASIATRGSGLDPRAVAERVRAERLPSAVIGDAMDRFGQQPRRRKGSVLNDVYLVSLSPYARLTSVDKGTFANGGRASARCPAFRSVIGRVVRGSTYLDLAPELARA